MPDSQAVLSATLSVEALESEYCKSRVATDTKYDGQLIAISGIVSHSGPNLEGDSTIWLNGSDERFKIGCVLRSKDLMNVVEGETCHLRGVYCISVTPTFVHCTLQNSTEEPIAETVENPPASGRSSPPSPEVTLTAEQLEAEIDADLDAAKRKYADKVLQITGRLSRISHVASGAMVYRMGAPLSTQYFIRTGNPWYCARPGHTVTLVGKWFSTYPCLINCEVVSVAGAPNSILTAVSLGEYLEANRVQFRKWFYLKQIIVTGEVIEKSAPNPDTLLGRFAITLRSTENTSVVCEMEAGESRAAESVQIGDSLTITGWNTKQTPTDSIILVQSLFWRGK